MDPVIAEYRTDINKYFLKNPNTFTHDKYVVLDIFETAKYINCVDNYTHDIIENRMIIRQEVYFWLKIFF